MMMSSNGGGGGDDTPTTSGLSVLSYDRKLMDANAEYASKKRIVEKLREEVAQLERQNKKLVDKAKSLDVEYEKDLDQAKSVTVAESEIYQIMLHAAKETRTRIVKEVNATFDSDLCGETAGEKEILYDGEYSDLIAGLKMQIAEAEKRKSELLSAATVAEAVTNEQN